MYSQLQLREIFHIEFLRSFSREIPASFYALKGGVNLRLFFKSFRYSEDMDLDVEGLPVASLQKKVLRVLQSRAFLENLKTFGIAELKLPDMQKAKQTETTQRFKLHLITSAGEDYFTKVEFSRRGIGPGAEPGAAAGTILRAYNMAPLIIPHYNANAAALQKVGAVLARSALQARDVFDLFLLSSQYSSAAGGAAERFSAADLKKAKENIFSIDFTQFSGMVLAFLSPEDRLVYDSPRAWDEVRIKAAEFIAELEKDNG